jgi:hypothetical protein
VQCGTGRRRVVFRRSDNIDRSHQCLDVGPLDEIVGEFAQAGALRGDIADHCELDAELRGQAGIRLVVAQHGGRFLTDASWVTDRTCPTWLALMRA